MKIFTKMVIITMSIAVIFILSLTTIIYLYNVNILRERVANQMQSIVTTKAMQLNDLIYGDMIDLEELSSEDDVVDNILKYRAVEEDLSYKSNITYVIDAVAGQELSHQKEALEKTKISISENISKELSKNSNGRGFSKVFILDTNGKVDFSTDKFEENKDKSSEKYFIEGMTHTYIQNYGLILVGEQLPLISTPIKDDVGNVLGVLVGVVDVEDVNSIMTQRQGLGESGEVLLINKNRLLITKSRFRDDIDLKRIIHTKDVDECMEGNSSVTIYPDYRGVTVMGAYEWIPERESCIIMKIDNSEILSPSNNLAKYLVLHALIILLFIFIVTIFISRSITRPFEELVRGTQELSSGNLGYKLNVKTSGEMKILIDSINKTSEELLRAKEREKNHSKQLELQLAEKTSEMKRNMDELELSQKAALNILEDLSEINTHLKELDQAKTDFLNIASHELKTPLTAISAYLEILDDYKGQFNEQQLQGLDAIKRNSNQLKTLINNILEVSRLESGRFELNVNNIDVEEKIHTILENLKILSNNKGLELKYSINGVKNISTDEMRFEEILNNLIGNAIKFTNSGSINLNVTSGTGEDDGMAVFLVEDTGVGIPELKLSNLFQNFYQVDSGISRRYGGTGLGLAITKKMIELQGGKISVTSIVGTGTKFRFTLPIKAILKKEIKNLTPEENVVSKAETDINPAGNIVKSDQKNDLTNAK